MPKHIENYFLDVITDRQKGFLANFFRLILWILSWPFMCLVYCRNWAFDQGLLRRYYPPVPVVISIGNIVVGGTGKTPVTLMLAEEFYERYQLAVLSRGYRSKAERLAVPVVLSKGQGPMQSSAFCGDEPFLISQNLPKALVIVGKNRHKASDMAARAGAQLILLDDGMQHRRLARDFEVVVMDVGDPFGQGYFLPRGLLREGASSLARADLVILNHAIDNEAFADAKAKLAQHCRAPILGTRMQVTYIETLLGKRFDSLEGMKVAIFCGIAHPEYFYDTISKLGAEIVYSSFTADHRGWQPEALAELARESLEKGAQLLLCTEKDRVKIPNDLALAVPLAWIKMHLELVEGQEEWRGFIQKVEKQLQSS